MSVFLYKMLYLLYNDSIFLMHMIFADASSGLANVVADIRPNAITATAIIEKDIFEFIIAYIEKPIYKPCDNVQ